MEIIIRDKATLGKTRSEQEENMRKEWGRTMSEEHLDKVKFAEKQLKEATGSTRNFVRQTDVDK